MGEPALLDNKMRCQGCTCCLHVWHDEHLDAKLCCPNCHIRE